MNKQQELKIVTEHLEIATNHQFLKNTLALALLGRWLAGYLST